MLPETSVRVNPITRDGLSRKEGIVPIGTWIFQNNINEAWRRGHVFWPKNCIMNMKPVLLLAAVLILHADANSSERYPQEALQCYSTSALQSQKDGAIICPIGTSVCIKEVVNATTRKDCGTVEGSPYYKRDTWDRSLAQCVYRKCASRCPSIEEDMARRFGGEENDGTTSLALLGLVSTPIFNRTSYCCDTNLCNHAHIKSGLVTIPLIFIVSSLVLL